MFRIHRRKDLRIIDKSNDLLPKVVALPNFANYFSKISLNKKNECCLRIN